jgi:hypothetical protein
MLPKPSPEGRSLEVPVWVPRSVRVLALDMYSELIRGPFDRETAAITRFATDEKMENVWNELLRPKRPRRPVSGFAPEAPVAAGSDLGAAQYLPSGQ